MMNLSESIHFLMMRHSGLDLEAVSQDIQERTARTIQTQVHGATDPLVAAQRAGEQRVDSLLRLAGTFNCPQQGQRQVDAYTKEFEKLQSSVASTQVCLRAKEEELRKRQQCVQTLKEDLTALNSILQYMNATPTPGESIILKVAGRVIGGNPATLTHL